MRVLALVTDAFGGHGGIALYNRDVLKALCQHEHVENVVAVARSGTNVYSETLPENLVYDLSGTAGAFVYLKSIVKTLLHHKNFDMLLCCHINLMPLAWILGKLLRIPVVLEIYGIEAWQPRGRWLAEFLSTRVKLVISISNYTLEHYLKWSRLDPVKCKILPNAIHTEEYGMGEKPEYLVRRYGLQNKKVLLTFGRLVSRERAKGFDEILDILDDLIEVYPNLVYIIAGDGDYRESLQSKVSKLGLESYVVFTGMVEEAEKADLYRLADAYVMPSRGEGFGFVFLEAMACGIPVVASKVDGSREAVLGGELGQLVDPDKPDEIKQKLSYFSYQSFASRLHIIVDDVLCLAGQSL